MKAALVLCFLLAVSSVEAVTVEQIGKLAELKTQDDLILELVQREGLDQPLTAEDVIVLREKGVSERVIHYLINLTPRQTEIMSKQEGESVYISKNIRAFTTRDKKGKPILMVTNLDEQGKRMGPPPPPNPEPEPYRETEPQPREVIVTVRHEEPEPYVDDPEYMEDPYYDPGIPLYPAYGGGFYPYYPVAPKFHNGGRFGRDHYNFDKPWGLPRARNSQPKVQNHTPKQAPAPKSATARTTSRSRW
jgi:hypothetical protein